MDDDALSQDSRLNDFDCSDSPLVGVLVKAKEAKRMEEARRAALRPAKHSLGAPHLDRERQLEGLRKMERERARRDQIRKRRRRELHPESHTARRSGNTERFAEEKAAMVARLEELDRARVAAERRAARVLEDAPDANSAHLRPGRARLPLSASLGLMTAGGCLLLLIVAGILVFALVPMTQAPPSRTYAKQVARPVAMETGSVEIAFQPNQKTRSRRHRKARPRTFVSHRPASQPGTRRTTARFHFDRDVNVFGGTRH